MQRNIRKDGRPQMILKKTKTKNREFSTNLLQINRRIGQNSIHCTIYPEITYFVTDHLVKNYKND